MTAGDCDRAGVPPSRQHQRRLAITLLLAVVFVWGSTFGLVKGALRDASPLLFNLLRMAVATAVLVGLHWRSLRRVDRRLLGAGVGAGILLGCGYQLQTAGLTETSPTNSAFLTGLVVVLVPLLSFVPLVRGRGPRPGWAAVAGGALGFGGLILLTVPPGFGIAGLYRMGRGDLLTILCAFAFAGHLLTLARFPDLPAAPLTTLQITTATVFMAFTLPLGGLPSLRLNTALVLTIVLTGVVATAVAFQVQTWAQQHISAGSAALILALEPVFALVVALALGQADLRARPLAGAALILAGILVAERFGSHRAIAVPPA